MATMTTYDQTRDAEDVHDDIYIISPIDNPVASMGRTIRATGKLHEWSEDALQAPKKNAKVEAAAAGTATHTPIVELNNPTQIMDTVASIGGTQEEIDKYGRDSEMAYQLELRYGELANDEESAIAGDAGGAGRQTKVTPANNATAREFASFHNQLDASVVEDATGHTTVPQLEASLLSAHLSTYNAGGNPSYLFTNPANAPYISSFAYVAGRQRDLRNERALTNVIDLYKSHFGELDVILDRNMDDDCFLLIDFNYFATPVLRATRDWALAKTGDFDERQILRESTCAVLNTKAHAMVDNIPAGLTVS